MRIIDSDGVSNQRNKRDQFELGVKEKRMRELGLFRFIFEVDISYCDRQPRRKNFPLDL